MKRLYFETETTGFPPKGNPEIDECPHIVQLSALLIDDEHGEVASFNAIIKPDGWTIPDDVAAIHGITTEKAAACGTPIKVAMAVLSQLCRIAEQVVAHNIAFDQKLVAYEMYRLGAVNVMDDRETFCTMAGTTDICKLPGRFPGQFKWPKLIEAHQHLFNEGFDGQHDALADVRACARVHRKLIEGI